MKTAQVRSIVWLRRCISWLGFAGIVSGLFVDSIGGTFSSAVLWWCAKTLVDYAWVYVEEGVVVFHDGVAIRRVEADCCLWTGDLPKGYSLIKIESAIGVAKATFYTLSSQDGGAIVPIDLTIEVAVGQTLKEITLYRQFVEKNSLKGRRHVYALLERFRREQLHLEGAFGLAQRQYVGTRDWIEHALVLKLGDFLEFELALIGLQIRAVGAVRGNADMCILLEGGE